MGSPVRRHYLEIKKAFETGINSENTTKQIKLLLNHAKLSTDFYGAYSSAVELSDFPVINKNIIKSQYDSFISRTYLKKKVKKNITSGSTGTPLIVYKNNDKYLRHIAENIYLSEIIGYRLGSRLYYLRVWNKLNKKKPLIAFSQNIILEDASDLSDEYFKDLFSRLKNDKSRKSILAFASTLEAFASFLSRNAVKCRNLNINIIISISESLPEEAQKTLNLALSCPVICRYSNIENGFVAQQCINGDGEYHLNQSSFKIELLEMDSDNPVKIGEMGRIVITDLYNFAMPLIRYDTGDIAVLSERSECGNPGPVFKRVEGRKVDFISDTYGRLLSPHVITNTMWKYASEVKQFQFIQKKENEYVLKLNCDNLRFGRDNELIDDLRFFLGPNAKISFEYVSEIPILSSGKRKKIINEAGQLC